MVILRALLYLRAMQLRNRVLAFLRRLKHPRYLIGLGMAIAYFWLVLFQRTGPANGERTLPGSAGDFLELFYAGLVTLWLLFMWLFPNGKPGLGFTEAEVAFLFPAPLKRSQLIHYKLVSGMLGSLLGSLFVMLLFTRAQGGLLHLLQYYLGWWLLTSIAGLHATGSGFTLARLGDGKVVVTTRRVVVSMLMAAFLLMAGWAMINKRMDALQLLLAPARLLLQPFFASGFEYLQSVLILFVLLALHYYWVLKLETPFEEESIVLATRRGAMIEQLRAGKGVRFGGKAEARREPFVLKAWMPVELVLLWKNMMLAPSYLNRRLFVACVVLIAFGMQWLHRHGVEGQRVAAMFGMMALMIFAMTIWVGPQFARIDLRSDLAQADMLKSWPVPGWRVVLGNLLAPTLYLTAIGWVLMLTALTGFAGGSRMVPWLTGALKISFGISGGLFLPVLTMLMLIGPNAAALLFPAWSQTGVSNQRGFDVMGLRMLLGIGQLLLLAVCLLPAALLGGVVFYFSQWFLVQEYGIVLAVVSSLVVLVLEILFAIHLLGERLERLDIAAELRQ